MRKYRLCTVRRKWKIIGSRRCHPWGWQENGKWWKGMLNRAIRQNDRAFEREIMLAVDVEGLEPRARADRRISRIRSSVDYKDW